jgi:adenine-specific DNA-methyltransferase
LEGGMTKEDQKRDEIFWNQTLAPDEISRLLDPKVFTNAKRIDKNGEHKFDGFRTDACPVRSRSDSFGENGDIKDNLIIKGNNLLALHSLKKRFAGKVKLIYIDPPYNTGGDYNIFTYNNTFNHSTWMTFMRNRIEIARDLLRDDGILAIAIDDFEQAYLRVLTDEIFGRENFIGTIAIQTNPGGRDTHTFFATSHDYCHFFAKDENKAVIKKFVLTEDQKKNFNLEDEKGKFRAVSFRRTGGYSTPEERPNSYYPIYYNDKTKEFSLEKKKDFIEILPLDSEGNKRVWRRTKPSFLELVKSNDIFARKSNGKYVIMVKDRLSENSGKKPKTMWYESKYSSTTSGTMLLRKILGKTTFSYPKSLYTVLDTLKITTNKDDIILDFFAGSGTTGHATLELNKEDGGDRKFILVEQLDDHIDICLKRICKVIQQSSKQNDFVYIEFAKWNENFIEKVRKAKTKEELKKLWETMKKKAFLSYKVDIKAVDENAENFADLSIENQKRFLLECLDKNHLYVNYSEIDDEEYRVSEEDKKLNKEFYKG